MMRASLATLALIGGAAPAAAPDRIGTYVALGSSYAAGVGLGRVLDGSPEICARTSNGYPQQLARDLRLTLVDASCGGATVEQIVTTGQGSLAPQILAVGKDAKLVTITAGGNDVGYVGDMMRAASAHDGASVRSADKRPFDVLRTRLQGMFAKIRQRTPQARIVIVTYPTVLPQRGTCDALGLTAAQVATFRKVAARLAAVTREAARQARAEVVDMATASLRHDVCSADRWTNGTAPVTGAPFHPNLAGATATARAVEALLGGGATPPRRSRSA